MWKSAVFYALLAFCLVHFSAGAARKLKTPKMFSSKGEMEKMVETEKKLYEILDNYTLHLEKRAEKLKQFHEEFRRANEQASNGVEEYLDNPISAFLFTRRLLVTWKQVEKIMTDDVGKEWTRDLKIKKKLLGVSLPSAKEMEYAAAEVKKLQSQYQLNATEMANGSPYGVTLSSGDCFELGREAYEDEDFDRANDWLKEARSRIADGRGQIEEIIEYLAASAYLQGRVRKALELTEELKELSPEVSSKAENNIKYYRNMIAGIEKKKKKAVTMDLVPDVLNWMKEDVEDFTNKICSNEIGVSPLLSSALKCRLVDRGIPFLKLAQLKEEVLFRDPRVVLYHDVLTDSAVEDVLAAGSGAASTVTPQGTTASVEEGNRGAAIAKVYAGYLSGLDTSYADSLQVVRYDANATITPHLDRQEPSSVVVRKSGNKLATIQYFLNDGVEGAVVFPALKLAVQPRKGSALFWLNLKQDGQSEDLTMHGMCPVANAPHWRAVEFIRTFGNELIRPCGLTQDS